jgi:serine/threonine protein kinase
MREVHGRPFLDSVFSRVTLAPPLQSAQRLGPYEILSALDAGGMGEVYCARDTRLQRNVAVKVLPAAFALNPDCIERLQREALLLASMNWKAQP